jgi:tape measure domain-containing protein
VAGWNIGDSQQVDVEVEMIGAREFQAEANANAASMERMGAAATTAGKGMEEATGRSWLMNQAMFTLRRGVYAGTLALAALGTGAVYMGLKFDATMEQNTITMSHFLGGVSNAKQELQTLFTLAAHGPFDFAGVTTAAKQFLAFGFGVKEVNTDLKTISDTAAAFGGSTDVINRIVLALGQMQAKGRVMGQELLQLQEVGIPALQILQQQLHLSDAQIANIGTTGIKASAAIPALIKGLQQRYGGLAEAQSKSLLGQISTLRDYTAQTLGTVMMPLFQTLKNDILPTAVVIATAIQKGFGEGGLMGSLKEIERSNAPGWFKILYFDIVQLSRFIQGPLVEGLKPVAMDLLLIAGAILYVLGPVLQFINYLDHFHHIIGVLITAWLTYRTTVMAIAAWNAILEWSFVKLAISMAAGGIKGAAGAAKLLWDRLLYGAVLEGEVMAETEALTVAYGEQAVATEALTVATAELDVALDANPIGLIILAVAALILLMIALATNFHGFRDWVVNNWPLVATAILAPFLLIPMLVVTYFDTVKHYVEAFIGWAADKLDWLKNKITGLPGYGLLAGAAGFASSAVGFASAHLADGGSVVSGGLSWVGERGPELMWLPPAASVVPLDHTGRLFGPDGGGSFTSHTTLVLDRKVVGEASSKYQLDREARK